MANTSNQPRCRHLPTTLESHPPDLPDEEMMNLVAEIKDYQITHGSLVKLVRDEEPHTVPSIPIGVSLFPTPFPRHCYDEAVSIQSIFNKLYARVAQDDPWLYDALKGLIETDDLVRSLWDIKQAAKHEGPVQSLSIGIFRSDYMLHGSGFEDAAIKQVEMNTFSVAGGTHANIVANMHDCLKRKGLYDSMCPRARSACSAVPRNNTISGIVQGLVNAFHMYGRPRTSTARGLCILMTVQPFNVNICDERPLEYALREQHGIPCFRVIHGDDVLRRTTLTETQELLFVERPAESDEDVSISSDDSNPSQKPWEVALVYHRAGHEPHEYAKPSGRAARLRLECSRAIKCPSIPGHLATLKHVQRALCEPQALRHFLSNDEASEIEKTFMPMYALNDNAKGQQLAEQILAGKGAEDYVLKPSLEGGGHNFFGADIADCLRDEREQQQQNLCSGWQKYVLMEMIRPPEIQGCLISPIDVYDGPVISEMGVFGACIWREDVPGPDHRSSHSDGKRSVLLNEYAGWSLKTKNQSIQEMSVIKGYGCFDSPLLIDCQNQDN